jgi:hypothetical protein
LTFDAHKKEIKMEEVWHPIENYENYSISNYGSVYNRKAEKFMALSRTLQGDLKVTLVNQEGYRVTRSIRVLVAEAFVPLPFDEGDERNVYCNTVIVLDGNKTHVSANNLAWRPRWFAQMYARQMTNEYPDVYFNKTVNAQTDVVYPSIIEAGLSEGLLFSDVLRSTHTGESIYPTDCSYYFA